MSVINASAFDDLTFDDVGPFGIGVKVHCSDAKDPIVRVLFLMIGDLYRVIEVLVSSDA